LESGNYLKVGIGKRNINDEIGNSLV